MTETATDEQNRKKEELVFAESQSRQVGATGSFMDTVRDNAPRIVAGFRLASDFAVASSLNPFWMGFAAFAGTGRVMTMIYGTKENQRKMAQEKKEHPELFEEPTGSAVEKGFHKITHPRQYPVEAGAGMGLLAQTFALSYAASRFRAGKTAYTPLIVNSIALFSYGNMLFGKEKQKEAAPQGGDAESLTFEESKDKTVGLSPVEKLKGNPILVSSIIQTGLYSSMVIGGIKEKLPNYYIAAGVLGAIGCAIQGMFVRKSNFNVEGIDDDKAPKPDTLSDVRATMPAHGREGGQAMPA